MTAFHHSRELPFPPAKVFAAIADPARLARWWGPDGFRNSFAVFQFEPGGRWVFTMHGPDGTDYPNEAVFAEIRPEALVRIRHTCAPLFELAIELQACPAGTRVVWTQRFDDPELARSLRPIVEPANEQNLDRLGRELAAGPQEGA